MIKINYLFFLLFLVSLATITFNSCSKKDDDKGKNPHTYDEGVTINGVKWATRNIDEPGTFATNPEDAGMFYQWNRKKAWANTGSVSGWYSGNLSGTTWEKQNDPSPHGWRIPTLSEIKTLFEYDKVTSEWITVNGVNGKKFTDFISGDTIFFPACGSRFFSGGTLVGVNVNGFYYSTTLHESKDDIVYYLNLLGTDASTNFGNGGTDGYSLRCVKNQGY